jgi:hypothetical protein
MDLAGRWQQVPYLVPAGSTANLASIWKLVSAHEHHWLPLHKGCRFHALDYFRKQSLTAHIVNYDFFVHVLMMIYAEKGFTYQQFRVQVTS